VTWLPHRQADDEAAIDKILAKVGHTTIALFLSNAIWLHFSLSNMLKGLPVLWCGPCPLFGFKCLSMPCKTSEL
jgi:hypothetical protein